MTCTKLSPAALAEAISMLETLSKDDLRDHWRRYYGNPAPKRLGADLLLRAVAYAVQAEARGGLKPALQRKLKRLARDLTQNGGSVPNARLSYKPGTRLVRVWRGETHEVTILEGDFAWRGRRFDSLSKIAREITGTRWSGPAFFGLNDRKPDARMGSPAGRRT